MKLTRVLVAAMAVGALLFTFQAPAGATGGEGEAWPSFTESSACGAQRISTPHAHRTGSLPVDYYLRGEFGAFFGRTFGDVFTSLVPWTVPGSTDTLRMHPFALEALERATDSLEEAMADGATYDVDDSGTFATVARTIGGSIRISRHAYGIAFDVNAPRNPHRQDNVLVTDIPDWWTQAFVDAGFCWGGLWIGSKDAMHFAWQGPAFSGYSELPPVQAPVTNLKAMTLPDRTIPVVPEESAGTFATLLADATGNGAADVVRISSLGSDLRLEVSTASRSHNACSLRTSLVADLDDVANGAIASGLGDWDGRGGNDLWFLTADGDRSRLTVRWAFGGYSAETSSTVQVPVPSDAAWVTTADFDADGALDLLVLEDGIATVWAIDPWSGDTSLLTTFDTPFGEATEHFVGDHDLDLLPDLWAIEDGKVRVALAADGYAWTGIEESPIGLGTGLEDVVAADYDGDGTADLIAFDGTTKRVWLRNTPIPDGLPLEVWFEAEEPECGEGEPTWARSELRFSTSGWVAHGVYGWRTQNNLPAGCDPEDDDCPVDMATRQDFAEFLAWIDGLPPASSNDTIAAARALDLAGYQLPCSLADMRCWQGPMLRTELSAYFGMFMADRRGDVPQPHRWVIPTVVESDLHPEFR